MSKKQQQTRKEIWVKVCPESEPETDLGVAFIHEEMQYALFKTSPNNRFFVIQNLCPHKQQMVLSRGIVGESNGIPKVSCPMHKRNFCLETGKCLNDDAYRIKTYPVKTEGGFVYANLQRDLSDKSD